ncbi:BTB domain-containing protein [Fusarium sp. LHS14.1]|nr:BTB domain-containing protein [Fusarium sp. LHS14.1]
MPPKKLVLGKKRKQPEPETTSKENETPFMREIILVVGPEKSKIRVSSHLLRTTSPVFNVMLGPNFKEGAALRENEGPTEIILPEDNAKALWNVYSTLCGDNPRVNKLKPDEIYDVAVLAQKYDLIDRLSLACESWFARTSTITYGSAKKDWKMLLAAYWLRSELGFRNTSIILIEADQEPLYRLGMETSDQVLGLRLCLAIQEHRVAKFEDFGLCLSCFDSPETEEFSEANPKCTSKYKESVLP